jgi:peptidylprolyl isomerase
MLRVMLPLVVLLSVLVVLTGCPKPAEETIAPPPPSAPAPPPGAEKPAGDETGAACKVEGEEGKPVEKTASGLQYVVLDPGTGAQAKQGDKVIAEYTGWLTDGTKFDSSKDHPGEFDFNVGEGNVIPGWDEAFLMMKEGERRKLIIPPDLAYGDKDMGQIPPNSTLVFEVTLVKIVK